MDILEAIYNKAVHLEMRYNIKVSRIYLGDKEFHDLLNACNMYALYSMPPNPDLEERKKQPHYVEGATHYYNSLPVIRVRIEKYFDVS